MAALILEDGRQIDDIATIGAALAPLGLSLQHWPLPDDATTIDLLLTDVLDDAQKATLLAAVEPRFDELRRTRTYTARDLVVLHPNLPEFTSLATKFSRPHRHPDDEVRYIIDGEGYFGVFVSDGTQALLKVEAGEYINVPAGTEHWFELGPRQRVKAVRYFSESTGWTAEFTDRPTSLHPQ